MKHNDIMSHSKNFVQFNSLIILHHTIKIGWKRRKAKLIAHFRHSKLYLERGVTGFNVNVTFLVS